MPQLFHEAGTESCLHAAVLAVAYANFHRRAGTFIEDGQVLGREYYGKALSLVSEATQREATARSDQVLTAVHVLGIYEVMSTGGGNNKLFWNAHAQGSAALLKLRDIPKPE
jgi:hypothetical protein